MEREDMAEHLGDGAYVKLSPYGEVVFTANHHDDSQATARVVLDKYGVQALERWLARVKEKQNAS